MRVDLHNPNQQESRPTEQHMRLNAVFQTMIHGVQLECRFQRPKVLLDIHQLLMPYGDILGRQGVIEGSNEIFAIVLFRFNSRLLVDTKCSILQLTEVFSIGRMRTQPAGSLNDGFMGSWRSLSNSSFSDSSL